MHVLVGRGSRHWMRTGVLLHHLIKTLIILTFLQYMHTVYPDTFSLYVPFDYHSGCMILLRTYIAARGIDRHQVKKRLHRNSASGPRPLSILTAAVSQSST
jgi:hypothetical protein